MTDAPVFSTYHTCYVCEHKGRTCCLQSTVGDDGRASPPDRCPYGGGIAVWSDALKGRQ